MSFYISFFRRKEINFQSRFGLRGFLSILNTEFKYAVSEFPTDRIMALLNIEFTETTSLKNSEKKET